MQSIGRAHERKAIDELFERGHRIVTLVGPPGVGKTRLAREWCGDAPFCELLDAKSSADVATAVAATLGATPGQDLGDVLQRHGRIVLDNLEQVVEEAAPLVARWAERVQILATSRERLRVRSEGVVMLSPLAPDDAVALLARAAESAGARVGAADLRAIAEAVDGLPLALELCAARLRVLGPANLLDQLRQPLRAMARAARDAPAHHESLERAIAGSWALLDDPLRRALARLGMLVGTFTLAEAQRVLSDAVTALEALCEKSLVVPQSGHYRMLLPIRAFAREHAQAEWIDGEVMCVRAEMLFRLGRHDESLAALDQAGALARADEVRSWVLRRLGRFERAREAAERALQRADGSAAPRILGALAAVLLEQGDLEEGRATFARVKDGGDPRSKALAIGGIGHAEHELGDLDRAAAAYDEASAALRALGDERLAAAYQGYRAMVAHERGDGDAEARYAAAIARAQPHADHFHGLFAACLGALRAGRGDVPGARAAFALADAALASCQSPAVVRAAALHRQWLEETALGPAELTSDDVRFAERLLRRRKGGGVLEIGAGFFRIAGERVVLGRRKVLWRILAALVREREHAPGTPVARNELIRAGWGDERMLERAAHHRLRVAIHELRRMGLSDVLSRGDDGYLLSCDVARI